MTLVIKPFEECDTCGAPAAWEITHGRKRHTLTSGRYCSDCSGLLWETGIFPDQDYWLQTRLNVALPVNAKIEASA